MILWGPPGVGKTTLARLMANAFGLDFIAISAVLGGVKDIRDAVERAQGNRARTGQPTVVFVDEVHRFNKAQQDAFLPHVESALRSSVPRRRTRRSRSSARCCRVLRSMCWSR
jgi:putative ATPase